MQTTQKIPGVEKECKTVGPTPSLSLEEKLSPSESTSLSKSHVKTRELDSGSVAGTEKGYG